MSDFGGGIPSQIVSELSNIPKQAVKDTAKAFGDIAVGTAEVVGKSVLPSGSTNNAGDGKAQEQGQAGSDPLAAMKQQKQAAAAQRLAAVRGELQEYFETQKKKKEQEEEMIEEQKKQEEMQIKQSKKKQEEQDVLRRLSGQYGGTGEIGKGGN